MKDTTFDKKRRVRMLDESCAGTMVPSYENAVVTMTIFVRSGEPWLMGDSFGERALYFW